MKRSRFSEEQIIAVLKEAEATSIKGACARSTTSAMRPITTGSINTAGMDVDEARRLRALQNENGRLKRLAAEQAIQIQILKEVNSKKW
jgi:putative transposase